jgi:glycosyltransferase involved in cell wall biosynthesis
MKSNSKKVLIVSHGLIPYSPSVGGVVRIITLANFLSIRGYEVFIISAKGTHFGDHGKKINGNIKVSYINDPVYKKIMDYYKNTLVNKAIKKSGIIQEMKKFVKTSLEEIQIDIYQYWTFKAKRKASELILKHNISNVIITSPPHSIQLVGYFLKRKHPNINLISDFRDSWNISGIFSKKTVLGRFISNMIERKIINKSDHLVYVSNYTKEKIKEINKKINGDKIKVIMNGFEQKLVLDNKVIQDIYSKRKDKDKLVFGYFGSISNKKSSFRNPDNFLKALSMIEEDILQNIIVKFYGNIDIDLKKFPKKIEKVVQFYPFLSHGEAIKKMVECDLLMVFHSESKGAEEVYNGKIFEYLSLNRPIMLCGTINMYEARSLVEKKGFGKFLDIDDTHQLKKGILDIFELWSENKLGILVNRNVDIHEFSREVQYEKFLELLK